MADWIEDEEEEQVIAPPAETDDMNPGELNTELIDERPFNMPQVRPAFPVALGPTYVPPDSVPAPRGKSSSKATRQRTIYTKNMQNNLPELQWLPGTTKQLHWNDQDEVIIREFVGSAESFGIISLMSFAAARDSKYVIAFVVFSTPTMTIWFDLRDHERARRRLVFPETLRAFLSSADILVVCPGEKDWSSRWSTSNFLNSLAESFQPTWPDFKHPIFLDRFVTDLCINESGTGVCQHMKFIYWLFQVRIRTDADVSTFAHLTFLPPNAQGIFGLYGKLLVYLYWAQCEKLRKFKADMKYGVDMDPIYLEDLLIAKGIVNDCDADTLRQNLLKNRRYPDPPLPGLPRPTKP
jgi:hypothetical protein